MSGDENQQPPATASARSVQVGGEARVGIVGDNAHVDELKVDRVDQMNVDRMQVALTAREVAWPVAVGSAPPLASAFQDRSGVLETVAQAGRVVVLTGDGGVGKSQLATRIYHNASVNLRLWVVAESRAAVLTGYALAAARLGLAEAGMGPEELAEAFVDFLAGTDRSALVVLDGVGDPGDLAGLWPGGASRVVATTRRRDAALSGGGRVLVPVGVYTSPEALAYLKGRLSPFVGDLPRDALAEAEQLAEDLGWLPLALAQAAAVVIDEGITCARYRARFADRATRLAELFPAGADADGYARTVATTWELAIQAADQVPPAGLAQPMAELVSVLDPAGIPEAVLTCGSVRAHLAAATGLPEASVEAARAALRALHRLSLLTHDPDPEQVRGVRMHNLTARAVRDSLPTGQVADLVRVAADALAQAWPDVERDLALAEVLRASTATLTAVDDQALWHQQSGAHPVLLRHGYSLREEGLVHQAITHLSKFGDRAEQVLGPDHPDTLALRNNLAGAYESAGDLARALPLFEQTLTDFERVLDVDHPDTLTARNNLAGAYESAGDLARALPLFEQTLTDSERVLGVDHPDTLTARNNLAGAYESAGDLGQAVPLFEQTLADRERVLGPDHPQTLTSRNNLAYACRTVGDLGQAVPLFEQTLADRERVLGPDHPDTLTSRNNLAGAHQSAGDLDRAIPLYEQTLTDSERVLGVDHPHTLSARNNLAGAHQTAGDLDRAVPVFEQTLTDSERVLGPDHPHTLTSRNNLAGAYQTAGNLDRAVPVFEQTLTDSERILGPSHPSTVIMRENLTAARLAADNGLLAGDRPKKWWFPYRGRQTGDGER